MSKLITREQTKQLTRSLPKEVPTENYSNIESKELYYGGKGVFRWYFSNRGRVPYGMEKVGIQLKEAFTNKGSVYVRKNLKELDDYFYYAINKL